jgi:hypothetical protein
MIPTFSIEAIGPIAADDFAAGSCPSDDRDEGDAYNE